MPALPRAARPAPAGPNAASLEALFTALARHHLGVPTLVTRGRDALDFHDVGVAQVRDLLLAVYDAGRRAVRSEPGDERRYAWSEAGRLVEGPLSGSGE